MRTEKVSEILDGAAPDCRSSTSDFINRVKSLKTNQFFILSGVKKRQNLYNRIAYCQRKHGISVLFVPQGDDYKIYLRPTKAKR